MVQTRVSQVRSRMVRFEYKVLDANTGEPLATGSTAHICLDRHGQPARIPEEWREFWSGLVVEAWEG